jgi:hypothetical protein
MPSFERFKRILIYRSSSRRFAVPPYRVISNTLGNTSIIAQLLGVGIEKMASSRRFRPCDFSSALAVAGTPTRLAPRGRCRSSNIAASQIRGEVEASELPAQASWLQPFGLGPSAASWVPKFIRSIDKETCSSICRATPIT